jgi:hypothetical protein
MAFMRYTLHEDLFPRDRDTCRDRAHDDGVAAEAADLERRGHWSEKLEGGARVCF